MSNETKQPTLPEAIALAREALNHAQNQTYPFGGLELFAKALAALDSLQVGVPVTDHIEDERGMAPVYQIRPDCENWIDCTEKYYAEWKGGKRTLYTQPADYSGEFKTFILDVRKEIPKNSELFLHPAQPCERCKELEEQVHFQSCLTRDLLPYQDEAVKGRDKLAALEAENARLRVLERDCEAQHGDLVKCNSELHATIAQLRAEAKYWERNANEANAANRKTIAQQAEQLAAAESRLHDVATHCATVEQQLAAAEKAMNRCYKMLLSEPDTKGALFKAENILREALADAVIAAQKGEK